MEPTVVMNSMISDNFNSTLTSNSNSNSKMDSNSNTTVTYNRPVSALEDPDNYNIRHPLQSKWTLWFRASTKPTSTAVKNAAKSDNWEASLQCVNTVDTIEDFWGMYNNVPGIDRMEDSSDYMFFKEGIRPAWEDPANANGGSFTLQFKNTNASGVGDFVWISTLLLVVGSTLTHYDKITGLVYSKRSSRADRLSLWLSSSDREICRLTETEWMDLLHKYNREAFSIGTPSFTNHKSSGSHHRGDREIRDGHRDGHRDGRDGRDYHRSDQRSDQRNDHRGDYRSDNNRDSRDNYRDNRDSRDSRDRKPSSGRFPSSSNNNNNNNSNFRGAFGSSRSNDWTRPKE